MGDRDLRVGVQTWEGDEAVIYAEAALRELAERLTIVEAAFDPWRFSGPALDLANAGLRMVQFPQSDSRLVPAGERLSAAIWSGGYGIPATRSSTPTSPPRSPSSGNAEPGSATPGVDTPATGSTQ